MDMVEFARWGLAVTVAPMGWPMRGPFQGVRVSVSGFDWNNSILTRNFELTAAELAAAEDPDALIVREICKAVKKKIGMR